MTLKDKYKNALALGEKLQIKDGYVTEENGKLKIGGTTQYQLEKDRLWDAIKKDGGENPTDLVADIKITDNSIYGIHTVESGDTLSKIAKSAYGDANSYMKIFEANRDKLNDPNMIKVGQELVIPN
ncbi:MAG: LysM peptidoglycan-binding domain-containing protein [Chitinophagales bacterium]|jgi:LysM repeat protein|nr:LysM peptidoglycan-binding domain-containing protein [Bacteroidota bacterium]MBK7038006.1 LysM peptidoglycan-binding domain-containing protein [Bacteroidota bacterium]MBP8916543.1 LysM peptidoglycan-binding domain-containing protein [Chitinophagales bacterium]MBP9221001.1 LysM peptidoglycan-binding domain-containing protein [Chitinophagales bacterium]MBP9796431.1 LysM peptidoglycan-binding domain-containing protein [Chitinophagales bacterium]